MPPLGSGLDFEAREVLVLAENSKSFQILGHRGVPQRSLGGFKLVILALFIDGSVSDSLSRLLSSWLDV